MRLLDLSRQSRSFSEMPDSCVSWKISAIVTNHIGLTTSTHLPINMESLIPHDTAGTEAPLYRALGPYKVSHESRCPILPLWISSLVGSATLLRMFLVEHIVLSVLAIVPHGDLVRVSVSLHLVYNHQQTDSRPITTTTSMNSP